MGDILKIILLVFCSLPVESALAADIKPVEAKRASLQQLLSSLDGQISAVFKQSQNAADSAWQKPAQDIYNKNLKDLQAVESRMLLGESFQRGELEKGTALNQLMLGAQLRLLQIRLQKTVDQKVSGMQPWLRFAADFPFEESTVLGLRTASVIRSLYFDELEAVLKNMAKEAANSQELLSLLKSIKLTWPVDRMLLAESRKILGDREIQAFNKVIAKVQKNPYQSVQVLMEEQRILSKEKRQFFSELWKDSDVQMMKEEINRLSSMRLMLAVLRFEQLKKRAPTEASELVQEKLLDKIPINYVTGKPMALGDISHLRP